MHRDNLYVIGGLQGPTSVDALLRAKVGRDGAVQRWDTLAPLPRARSHHAVVLHDGALYLIGGLDGNPAGANTPLTTVIRAPIRPDGTLGAWSEISAMEHAYATHAAAVHDGQLFTFGGVEDNARFVDIVWRAALTGDGSLGAWQRVEPGLPNVRSHVHQLPIVGGRIYSAGGSNARRVTADVYVGIIGTRDEGRGTRKNPP